MVDPPAAPTHSPPALPNEPTEPMVTDTSDGDPNLTQDATDNDIVNENIGEKTSTRKQVSAWIQTSYESVADCLQDLLMELIKRDPHACINPVDPTVSAKPLDANNLPQDVYVEDFWRLPTKGFRGKVHIMTTIDKDEIRSNTVLWRG